ncbi:MAG: GNAT family protein [Candidatus Methanoperedens sp.]|nr:GNAT family protein [Candidatus Methanoperedens sp.]CAG0969997.1 diamine N-acetyltransferase [Methanosarcinales archaeon]
MKIIGERIFLKLLSSEDISQFYVDWMQDEEVIQFLESRWKSYTLNDLRDYVKKTNDGINNFLFGIFLIENDEHIGNIKIGGINQIHRSGDVGILIGNKKMWGKGYGTEAIKLATKYAFEELNLNKVFAGMYANNQGSFDAFMRAGYREAGRFKNHMFFKGKYVDGILVEKLKETNL